MPISLKILSMIIQIQQRFCVAFICTLTELIAKKIPANDTTFLMAYGKFYEYTVSKT